MQVIWKYLLLPGKSYIEMPERSNVLHVGSQGDDAFIWVLVDPTTPVITRSFVSFYTGQEITEKLGIFHGTFIINNLVFHLFEVAGDT